MRRVTPHVIAPAAPSRPARVLLVDDDPLIREMITAAFEDGDYAVTACSSPRQMAALLAAETFDLVLADGLGRHFEEAWRTAADIHRATGATPAILFSAHEFDREAVRALGFRDYIAKPFNIDELEARVACIVGRSLPPPV
jgi:DNA-binding response OmpR family regulator